MIYTSYAKPYAATTAAQDAAIRKKHGAMRSFNGSVLREAEEVVDFGVETDVDHYVVYDELMVMRDDDTEINVQSYNSIAEMNGFTADGKCLEV